VGQLCLQINMIFFGTSIASHKTIKFSTRRIHRS